MRCPSFFSAAIAIVCAVLAGCSSGGNSPTPTGEASISLSTTARRTVQTVKLDNVVIIALPPANSTTHAWQIAQHDGRYLQQTSDVVPAAGKDDRATVTFIAARTGTTRLRFLLLPLAAGRQADPLDGHELVLTIQ